MRSFIYIFIYIFIILFINWHIYLFIIYSLIQLWFIYFSSSINSKLYLTLNVFVLPAVEEYVALPQSYEHTGAVFAGRQVKWTPNS